MDTNTLHNSTPVAYRNARKEENEMFKMDFEEEFDQDLEANLRNIEKYVCSAKVSLSFIKLCLCEEHVIILIVG